MDPNRRDETARFMEALAALSTSDDTASLLGRFLALSETEGVDAVLREINETVLRRRLEFRMQDGGCLGLEVAERRILAVEEMPPRLAKKYADIAGCALVQERAARFNALLADFCVPGQGLHVLSCISERADLPDFGGLSLNDMESASCAAPLDASPPEWAPLVAKTSKIADWGLIFHSDQTVVLEWGARPGGLTSEAVVQSMGSDRVERLWACELEPGNAVVVVRLGAYCGVFGCASEQAVPCFSLWRTFFETCISGDQAA